MNMHQCLNDTLDDVFGYTTKIVPQILIKTFLYDYFRYDFGTFIRVTFINTIEGIFLKSVIVMLLTYSWTNVLIMLNMSCSRLRDWYSSAK